MTDSKWYEDMAAAMRERDKCLNAVTRWQESLAAAEAKIQALRESDVGDQPAESEAPPVDVPTVEVNE